MPESLPNQAKQVNEKLVPAIAIFPALKFNR
jgi:hypothetical protein